MRITTSLPRNRCTGILPENGPDLCVLPHQADLNMGPKPDCYACRRPTERPDNDGVIVLVQDAKSGSLQHLQYRSILNLAGSSCGRLQPYPLPAFGPSSPERLENPQSGPNPDTSCRDPANLPAATHGRKTTFPRGADAGNNSNRQRDRLPSIAPLRALAFVVDGASEQRCSPPDANN